MTQCKRNPNLIRQRTKLFQKNLYQTSKNISNDCYHLKKRHFLLKVHLLFSGNDNYADILTCTVCLELIHDCVSLQPCLHSFCSGCFSEWMEESDLCPICRVQVIRISKNHTIGKLIEKYIENNPDKARSKESLAELDSKNKITHDMVNLSDLTFYWRTLQIFGLHIILSCIQKVSRKKRKNIWSHPLIVTRFIFWIRKYQIGLISHDANSVQLITLLQQLARLLVLPAPTNRIISCANAAMSSCRSGVIPSSSVTSAAKSIVICIGVVRVLAAVSACFTCQVSRIYNRLKFYFESKQILRIFRVETKKYWLD